MVELVERHDGGWALGCHGPPIGDLRATCVVEWVRLTKTEVLRDEVQWQYLDDWRVYIKAARSRSAVMLCTKVLR